MNKKELIERIEGLKNIFGNECEYVKIDFVIELASELDEPQKVAVPQFVAEVIEGAKEESPELEDLFRYIWFNEIAEEFTEWYGKKSNRDLFVRAWLDGYEVEKEKQYLVKVKGLCGNHETLNCEKHSNDWLFSSQEENSAYKTHHTRKELEDAGFGEVFDSPLFEVEEVTE